MQTESRVFTGLCGKRECDIVIHPDRFQVVSHWLATGSLILVIVFLIRLVHYSSACHVLGRIKNEIRFSSFFFRAGGKGGRFSFLFLILDELFLKLIDA